MPHAGTRGRCYELRARRHAVAGLQAAFRPGPFRPRHTPGFLTMRIIAGAFALSLLAVPAFADEMWSSDIGDIVYLADIGDVAVLSYGDGTGFAYVPGLPGAMESRNGGTFYGYWIETGYDLCGATLIGPDGTSGNAWGQMVIEFDSASFPSGFTAQIGACFDPASDVIVASPMTGAVK